MVVDQAGSIDLTYQAHDGVYPPDFPHLTLAITGAGRGQASAKVVTTDYEPVPQGSVFTLRTVRPGLITLSEPSGYTTHWCDEARFSQGDCGA
jgi:hypothetical protein